MVQLNQNPDAFPFFLSILHDQWKLSQPIGVFGTFKNVYLERILNAMSSEIAKVAVFFFHWRVRCARIIINIILVSTMDRWVSGVTNHLAVNMSPSIDGYWRELFLFLYIFLSDHVCKRSLFSFIFYRRLCAICFQRNCYNERENRRKITLKKRE